MVYEREGVCKPVPTGLPHRFNFVFILLHKESLPIPYLPGDPNEFGSVSIANGFQPRPERDRFRGHPQALLAQGNVCHGRCESRIEEL